MSLTQEIDYGTPASKSKKAVTLTIDGAQVTVPEGTSIMRAAMETGTQIPKLCATDMLEAFGSCRLCLVEIEGRTGTPASCTTPVAEGMVVQTQTDRLKRLRKGVMELYISDHPLDCLTCSANGDCELQDMAGAVGLREVRYGYDGERHPNPGDRHVQPLFHLRSLQVHRLLALRARLRGGAGHLRADHRRARLRLGGVAAACSEPFLDSECVSCGACVQACPTATLTEKTVIEIGTPEHSRGHDLRLLRRRLRLQGRDARRRARAHGAVQGRQGQSRPFLRQGPLRLGLRHPQGPHPEADDPRQDHRPVARGLLGRGDRLRGVRVQAHPGEIRQRARSAASPPRAAPTRRPSWCRS